ncbi:hypothetical protein VYU27_007821 [Nannochloropsis oceanica]
MLVSLGTERPPYSFLSIIRLLLLSLLTTTITCTTTPVSPLSPTQYRIGELEHLAKGMAHRLRRVETHQPRSNQPQQQHSSFTSPPGSPPPAPRCVFSDLDGTLLHFGGDLLNHGYEILPFNATSAAVEGREGMRDGDARVDEASAAISTEKAGETPAPLFSSPFSLSTTPVSFCDSAPVGKPSSSSSSCSVSCPSHPLTPPFVHKPDPSHPLPRYVTLRYKPDGTSRACIELPSLSSGPGYISLRTLRLVQAIRGEGCLVVLITGARSSTYLMRRRTGLPVVDYECIEGGGRLIHDPHAVMDFATIRQEEENPAWDVEWQEAVGPLETLWALYKEMEEAGWRVDGRDYYTNFRVDTRGKPKEEWEALKERLPALNLSSSFNLGKADIYPSTSGKAAAVARLLPRLFLHPDQCVALFDDDNDLGMATLCQAGRRIAVSITHPSVQAYVKEDKRVETVSRPGILGSEEALERVLVSLGRIH